ncbi:cyclase family protein [Oerskovia sp. Sa1BUA8]|uniref:Cyclase family protein n=1 Tax=Oerskovia douganii TaxID=2762210 RepID=A0A9D5YZ45_9CELL|nr:cyclase family protein [Oerskovia douganii]MBE7700567.1 cyclase family protein [Oerskovia douganii]
MTTPQHRAHLDAHVTFANGGSLRTEGFRLDVPSGDLQPDDVARLLVRHLGLALVGSVEITGLTFVEEPHVGSRGAADAGPVLGDGAAPAGRTSRLVELSHTLREGLVTYPGLPAPTITPFLTRADSVARYAPGTQFAMDVLTMIGNTGTYLDSPFHRYEGGTDLAGLDLETLVGLPAEVFRLTEAVDPSRGGRRGIGAEVFLDRELAGSAVLLQTGWDRHFGTPAYGEPAPYLTEAGAQHLVDAGVALVGIDSLNIDDTDPTTSGGARPAHSLLLAAGIHVVEHLTNLGGVPPRGARFTAVPPKVEGFGTFPVRAFAEVPEGTT